MTQWSTKLTGVRIQFFMRITFLATTETNKFNLMNSISIPSWIAGNILRKISYRFGVVTTTTVFSDAASALHSAAGEAYPFDLLIFIPISCWVTSNIFRELAHLFVFVTPTAFFGLWAILGAAGETYSFGLSLCVSISSWITGNIFRKIKQGLGRVAAVTHLLTSTFYTLSGVAYKLAEVLNSLTAGFAIIAPGAATHYLLYDFSGMATKVF